MADVQPRPSRGRGSARGRGAFSSRGSGRTASKSANTAPAEPSFIDPLEEDSEFGRLKKRYKTQLTTLKELFPDWTLDDLVFALQETDGDLENTVERITDGWSSGDLSYTTSLTFGQVLLLDSTTSRRSLARSLAPSQ